MIIDANYVFHIQQMTETWTSLKPETSPRFQLKKATLASQVPVLNNTFTTTKIIEFSKIENIRNRPERAG